MDDLKRSLFPEGTIVEVKSDEEGLKGVYFTATVIACNCKSQKRSKRDHQVFVEYQHLFTDENGSERLREFIEISRLRPALQDEEEEESSIKEGEMVEAFYNDGWWVGVVKQVVVQEQGQIRYIVSFQDPPDELEFDDLSQIRLHLDWVDGMWVRSKNLNQDIKQFETESMEKAPVTGNTQNIVAVIPGDSSTKDDDPHRCQFGPTTGKRSMRKRTLKKVVKESGQRSLKRGTKRNKDDHDITACQVEGRKTMVVNCSMEVEKVVLDHEDDESLSKWIKRKHSRSVTDASRISPVKQKDAVMVDKGPTLPPFLKTNDVLWETIESMEVFKRIPQKPHFQPLEQYKESLREGLAIGYMIAFSRVVEKASRLKLNDPKSITNDIMETLVDLETYGFDVKVVQVRVFQLLELKDKREKLVNEVHELNNQILEHINVKDRIEEEIKKLQSAKEKVDDEIASLQARLHEMEESIMNLEHNFEGVVSST